jgi:ribosomal protein S18 acetylase RimI-like enzyme
LAVELISNIEKDLKDRGVKEVDLIVNKEKVEAVGLYKKLGYELVNETDEKMGDGKVYPCLFMTKQLM